MALANCARCKGIFNKVSGPVCPACIEQEEKDFKVVNDALREESNQTVEQLAEKTGVSEKMILRLIKDKRIASDTDLVGVTCGKCGAPAISLATRLCERCAGEMSKAIGQARTDMGGKNGQSGGKEAGDSETQTVDETVHEAIRRKTGKD